jgi:hypothetical protein
MYLDFYVSVKIKMNLTRHLKIMTDCGKRAIFDKLSNSYAKHLAVDEIIVLLKGRIIFKWCIPKRHKWFGINLYKLCGSKVYTYNMTVYLGKDRKCATHSTATHATHVRGLAAGIEHV